MEPDPLGRAMLDYARGGLRGECLVVDGADTGDAAIRENYFTPPAEWRGDTLELLRSLSGPVLDAGCGAGQHARWFEDHGREVVGIDRSPNAVRAARERGVDDARVMDMFDLDFPRDRFRTAFLAGTQAGLAGSLAGVRAFLRDLAAVTDPEGVAVVDNYDPTALDPEFFGYRPDPRRGVARRTFHVEYRRKTDDGRIERETGRSLSFLLCSPDRLADAAVGTPWTLDGALARDGYYRAVLEKPATRG